MKPDEKRAPATDPDLLADAQAPAVDGDDIDDSQYVSGLPGFLGVIDVAIARIEAILLAIGVLLMALNTAVVLGLGALRVMDGEMTMGMLVAFQALTASFIAPVNQLVGLGGTLQEVEGDLGRLDDVLRASPERPADPAGRKDLQRKSGF